MMVLDFIIALNVIFNLVLSLIIIVWDLYFYFKMDEKEKWTKLVYVFVGMCWFVRYILYFTHIQYLSHDADFNPLLVILVTFTLLALAIGSIIRVQRIVGFAGLKNDVKNLITRIMSWTSSKS